MSKNTEYNETALLDRELFFGNPEIIAGKLSPDGLWLSFLKEYNGLMNIWVKKIDDPFEKAYPLTDTDRPLYSFFWTYDSKHIVYLKDNKGDENENIFVVDPFSVEENKIKEARNLTPLKDVAVQIYKVSKIRPNIMMIGINDRDKAWHDLYQLDINTGELKEIYKNTSQITSYEFDWDDNLRILLRTDEKGNTEFLRIDGEDKLTLIYDINVNEGAVILAWTKDNKKIYLESNKGDVDLSTLYLMDVNSLEIEEVESDPNKKVDLGGAIFDQNTREIIATYYIGDKIEYHWKNETWKGNFEFLSSVFPDREVNFTSTTKDYSKFLVTLTGDKYASKTYLFENESRKISHQYTSRPELEEIEEHLSSMEAISFKSSDGLEISGYLSLPKGDKKTNLPLVALVHGGPKGPRDYWGYNSIVQFLANRGYAVLQVNFRASGGYGKAFLNAGDLQWGKLMQDDITFGVKYLVDKGIADKEKLAIMGGSYGGYATLAGLAFTPDLYACGIDIVGPSNIFTLLESIPPYWEAGRAFLYGMVGDPSTEEGKKLIEEASPLFSVDKINRPLLIVQGANDPRVKQAEADQIVEALHKKNKQVNYILADDEGHGFAKPINNMAMYAEVEKFLAGILGGRYQSEMPKEVKQRLEEMTVDVEKYLEELC